MSDYLDALDAAADWQPEGGDWDAIDPTPPAYLAFHGGRDSHRDIDRW